MPKQKNVVVETAGTLSTLIPAEEVSTLTTLTVSGSINKTDLDTLNGMPALTTLDLSQANIVAETVGEVTYAANTVPEATFASNKNLISVVFPKSLQQIETEAFSDCSNISTLDFSTCPELTIIGYRAFWRYRQSEKTLFQRLLQTDNSWRLRILQRLYY